MAQKLRLMVVTTLAILAHAQPAQAQGWRWLEKLSGPGDFYGFSYEQKILCKYESTGLRVAAISAPCIAKLPKGQEPVDERRIWAIGASVSYLRALSNDLQYASDDIDRTTQILAFEGFADHRVGPRIDLGIAVGLNFFIVPEADNFTRVTIDPRVTLKLFDLKVADDYRGTFGMRIGVMFFTDGFVDTDFGAIPGTYSSGTEISPSVRFVFDFDRNPFRR